MHRRPHPSEPFSLIHVGKCAGSSVGADLRAAGFQFDWVHVRKPELDANRCYVILVRDPVARFVSAFQWRKHVLRGQIERLKDSCPGTLKQRYEHDFLELFNDINTLAEQIDANNPTAGLHGAISLVQLIGHVPLGFAWYLDGLLERVDPGQLLAAVAVETLASDMQQVFGISVQTTEKMHYSGKGSQLSELGHQNLKRLFEGEYRTLRQLDRHLTAGGGYRPSLLKQLPPAGG
ncbi:MAG: hypothetical protein VKN13_06445 [Cyanobacteriota bacterium]|nr:hypothetical protein [Cyanobacteriota bacterium]